MGVRKTHEEFVNDFKAKNKHFGDIILESNYIDCHTDIKCKCKICSLEWNINPSCLLAGHGCRRCAGKMQKTHDEFVKEFNEKSRYSGKIKFLTEYHSAKEKMLCKCNVCGHEWESKPSNLLHNRGCPKCNQIVYTVDDMKRMGNDIGIDIIATEYKNVNTKIPFICRKHLDLGIQYTTMRTLIKGQCSCKGCRYKKVHDKRIPDLNTVKIEFEEKGLILLENYYINCKTPMRCICSKHKNIGEMLKTYDFVRNSMTYPCEECRNEAVIGVPRTPVSEIKELLERNGFEYVDCYIVPKNLMVVAKCFNHKEPMMFKRIMSKLRSEDGYMKCPYCNTSRLEIKIGNVLQNMGIEYETQKKFDDLLGINGGKLSYDFYIPSLNVAIEGNGSQHYKPSETFGGEKQFEKQLEHDKRKREYALLHGFKLIEIPYYEFRFIEDILAKELNLEVKEVS